MTNWQIKSLSEACTIKPPKAQVNRLLADGDLVSFAPMETLGIDSKYLQPQQTRPLGDVKGSYTYFADGDVLLAKITPCFENGKLGIARDLVNGVGFGSSEYIVLRPSEALTAEFLYYYLSRPIFLEQGARSMTGAVGHKRVSKEFIDRYSIPMPTIREQRHIVAILDEAFEAIATAKANAEKNQRNVSELFDGITKNTFKLGAQIWAPKFLAQISTNLDSKRIPITKSERKPGEVPYYGASGIVDYVADHLFEGDTLLVSEDGANLLARSTPIAFSVSGRYWVNNHAHILKFDHMATQRFVEFFLESIPLDTYITGAAQPKLNQKALNSIPIPIPSNVEEQAAIVRKLEDAGEQHELLRGIYERKITALKELKNSLLHRAFTGQLTARTTDQQLAEVA